MEDRRILYGLGSSGRNEWMFKLSAELKNILPHQPFFRCGMSGYHFIKDKANQGNILFLDEENQTKIKEPNLQFLEEAEEKFNFNIWDTWEIVAPRIKKKRKDKEEKTLKLFEYLIKEQGDFLDKNRITDYVIYGPTSYSDAIILKIMESKNINIINLRPSPLNKQFCISKNMSNELYGLKENYQKIKEMGLSKEEQEQVSDIFQRYREKNYKPDCAVSFKESKIQKSSRYLKAGWKMLKSHYLPSISLLRMWSWGVIQKGYDHLDIFENPVEGEKFVLFPLHYQPEASTLIHGKWYHNQLTLIDNLIRSIPVGYKLYVKEHSHGYGNRNLKFFKEIKKYTNVRLISPHANNLDLIEKSSLVTTITGTSGWEAIMLQKPVVVFGDVFYGVFDCVKKIKNIEELPNAIRERLDKKTSSEEAITCLASMVKSTYPGLARLPGGCANQSLQEENIKLLASGIVQHIKHTTPIHQPLSP